MARPYLSETISLGSNNFNSSATDWPSSPLTSFESIETFGDVHARTRSQVHIPLLLMSLVSTICALCLLQSMKSSKTISGQEPETDQESEPSMSDYSRSVSYRLIVIITMSLLFFLTQGIENTSGTYLMTFVINTDLRLDQNTGALINGAFGAAYAGGSACGVLVALFVPPKKFIFILMTLIVGSCVVFELSLNSNLAGMFIGAILLGAGCSALFGNLISLMSQLINVGNSIGALIILASIASSGLYPLMVGGQIEKRPLVLIEQNAISVLVAMGLAVGLLIYVRKCSKQDDGQCNLTGIRTIRW